MEGDRSAGRSGGDDLQFEMAEDGQAARSAMACAVCTRAIASEYFEAQGTVVCAACRVAIETARAAESRVRRFLRAGCHGALAAVLGALLAQGVEALTGYQFGLIAIVIGIMVGRAVRSGNGGRGGLVYQTLAIALTYCAMASTYMPYTLKAMGEIVAGSDRTQPGVKASPSSPSAPAPAAPKGAADRSERASPARTNLALALYYGFAFVFALAVPFLLLQSGEGLMGALILAIGLYEAWRVNAAADLTFQGPFRIGGAADPGADGISGA
jgi:hypothetical protein